MPIPDHFYPFCYDYSGVPNKRNGRIRVTGGTKSDFLIVMIVIKVTSCSTL